MNKKERARFLQEAIRIGNQLVAQAIEHRDTVCWKTMNWQPDHADSSGKGGQVIWEVSTGLYDGVAGIALFLLELHQLTQDPTFLRTSEKAFAYLDHHIDACEAKQRFRLANAMGVVYPLVRAAQLTGKEQYTQTALKVVQSNTLESSLPPLDDYIAGSAGYVLMVLHLYNATGQAGLLPILDSLVGTLLQRMHNGKAGLFWQRLPNGKRANAGFAHGNSGIGFVLLELGQFFNNPAFFYLANQAFAYENEYFHSEYQNWPDVRVFFPYNEVAQVEKYLAGDQRDLDSEMDVVAWCYGATGVGLSRLKAFEFWQAGQVAAGNFRTDIQRAIKRVWREEIVRQGTNQFTLCHASGGNAEIFIEAYRIFRKRRYLDYAATIAHRAIDCKNKGGPFLSGYNLPSAVNQEDLTLFMGNAGIGYFLLRLLAPDQVPSILAPSVRRKTAIAHDVSVFPSLGMRLPQFREAVVARTFRRTLYALANVKPDAPKHYLEQPPRGKSEVKNSVSFISSVLPSLPTAQRQVIREILRFEKHKWQLDAANENWALNFIEAKIIQAKATDLLRLSPFQLLQKYLVRYANVSSIQLKWDWDLSRELAWQGQEPSNPGKHYYLLYSTSQGVFEEKTDPLSYLIMAAAQTRPITVSDLLNHVLGHIAYASPEEEQRLKSIVIVKVKELIRRAVLIEPLPGQRDQAMTRSTSTINRYTL